MHRPNLGLVLEGGAMRGLYTAGVLDVFLEQGIAVDGVIGVSAGTVHGVSYVSGQHGRSIRYYEKYRSDKRFMGLYPLLTTGDIVDKTFCYEDIPWRLDPFDNDAFVKAGTPFYVTCTNVETGKADLLMRRYLSVDGGMSDNIRPALYGSEYDVRVVNRRTQGEPVDSRIVGFHCESGDILVNERRFPSDITTGDLLAFATTGAYQYMMASRYNGALRPAVVSVSDGKASLMLRRETVEDLLALDVD